ncbi:unnamed protein product [Closterium sp. NIES-65]|nr:unnamed protein product [Closterium sp. NIES-65]
MASKRKSEATTADMCVRDLNEITYIAWINKQLAAERKPAGPLPEGTREAGKTSYQALRDVPSRGRRVTDRVASSRVMDDDAFGNEDDDLEYNECDNGTKDEADSGKEEDKGMSDSEEEIDADDANGDEDDAPEEAQPAEPKSRCGRTTTAAAVKTAAKGGEPPRGAANTLNMHPIKRGRLQVAETATMAAKFVCETIKGCQSNRLEGLVRAWMEQDERIAREHQVQRASTPPARNDILDDADNQPATNAAKGGDDEWFHRRQAGDSASNPNAAEEV